MEELILPTSTSAYLWSSYSQILNIQSAGNVSFSNLC